jgi:hypothetical protein
MLHPDRRASRFDVKSGTEQSVFGSGFILVEVAISSHGDKILKGGSLRAFRTGACLFESRIPERILIFVRLGIPAIFAQPRAVIVLVQRSGIRASMTLYSWAHRHSYLAVFAHGLILHYREVWHPVLTRLSLAGSLRPAGSATISLPGWDSSSSNALQFMIRQSCNVMPTS